MSDIKWLDLDKLHCSVLFLGQINIPGIVHVVYMQTD